MITELAALVLPLGGLLALLLVLMRPLRSNGTMLRAHRLLGLRGYRLREDGGPGTVFIASLAGASLSVLVGPDEAGLALAAVLGLTAGTLGPGRILDLIGAAAAVAGVVLALRTSDCDGSREQLIVGIVVLGCVLLVVTGATFWRVGRRRLPGLVAFGLLELLILAAAPLGAVLGGDVPRWIASLGIVVVFGVLAGAAPVMAVELLGVVLLVVGVWSAAFVQPLACGDSPSRVLPAAAFAVAYLVMSTRRH
jgi:hypothetical protein